MSRARLSWARGRTVFLAPELPPPYSPVGIPARQFLGHASSRVRPHPDEAFMRWVPAIVCAGLGRGQLWGAFSISPWTSERFEERLGAAFGILPQRLRRFQSKTDGDPVALAPADAAASARVSSFLQLELAQPFDKALVLDLVVAILKLHHQLVLLQTTQCIFRCI
jgi:hypothetical protein